MSQKVSYRGDNEKKGWETQLYIVRYKSGSVIPQTLFFLLKLVLAVLVPLCFLINLESAFLYPQIIMLEFY